MLGYALCFHILSFSVLGHTAVNHRAILIQMIMIASLCSVILSALACRGEMNGFFQHHPI